MYAIEWQLFATSIARLMREEGWSFKMALRHVIPAPIRWQFPQLETCSHDDFITFVARISEQGAKQ